MLARLATLLCLAAPFASAQQTPAQIGQWAAPQTWPDVAVHSTLLPDGRVMWFPYTDKPRIWDPATNLHVPLPGVGYNPFCSHHAWLADGRLLVVSGHIGGGGVGEPKASIYDPFTGTWLRIADINAGRWYPGALTLANGDVLALSGMRNQTLGLNVTPEVWQASTGAWRQLTGATNVVMPMYPRSHVAPDGRVFVAGPNVTSYYLSTTGSGAWTAGPMRADRSRDYAPSVEYAAGKILYTGGGDPALASAETINLGAANPQWALTSPMNTARRQHQLTMLPDGRVLATHGSTGSGFDNKATPPLPAEVWNPDTGLWSVWATPAEFRGYHHSALLLPDGRILAAGADQHLTAEIFSPPYLFAGARPVISTAPAGVSFAQQFAITSAEAASVGKVTLVGLSTVSHSMNTGQQFASLPFSRSGNTLTATAPASGLVLRPGYYLLFLVSNSGVPSVGKVIRLGATSVPAPLTAPTAPSALSLRSATANQIDIGWADNSTNETGFRIERRTGTFPWADVGVLGPNFITHSSTGLSPNTGYTFRVRAWNAAGESPTTAELTVSTTASQVPQSVTLMSDLFTDNLRDDAKWAVGTIAGGIDSGPAAFDSTMTVAEVNQRLEISPRANIAGDHFAGYVSRSTYNLTDAAARAEILAAPGGGVTAQFALCLDMQNFLTMAVVGDTLICDVVLQGDREPTGVPFNASAHRFWRIRHSANGAAPQIAFEASANGVDWTVLRTEAPLFALTALKFEISAGTTAAVAAPGMVIFDRVSIATNGGQIIAPTNQPPIAHPGGPYAGLTSTPLTLNGSASSDPDGSIVSYSWDFGDGSAPGSGVSPSHSYTASGYYVARLTVTDDKGATASEGVSILINPAQANQPPIARPGGPYSAPPGSAITFNGTASSDPDGALWEWHWDFGDGSTAAGPTVTHAYAAPGSYTVRLTVIDSMGTPGTATVAAAITGSNVAPIARIGGPYTGKIGSSIAFDASTSSDADGSIAGYAWNFGDGGTASGAKPTHTFTATGSHTVTLMVTDNKGATATATTTVPVTSAAATTLFADDFDDNIRNPAKWTLGALAATTSDAGIFRGVGVFERNRRVEILPMPRLAGQRFFGITGPTLDLTGAGARVQVPVVPASGAEAVFSLVADRENYLQMRYKNGIMTFTQAALGLVESNSQPYIAAQSHHWRIRHDPTGNLIRYETSADGAIWTIQRNSARKVTLTNLRPELAAGTNSSTTTPGFAAFDSFAVEK